MTKAATLATLALCYALSACSATPPCEDILEVKQQKQTCAQLSRIMQDNKHPQQALTARKRYQTECQDLRYYRDDYDTICKGNRKPIGQKQD